VRLAEELMVALMGRIILMPFGGPRQRPPVCTKCAGLGVRGGWDRRVIAPLISGVPIPPVDFHILWTEKG